MRIIEDKGKPAPLFITVGAHEKTCFEMLRIGAILGAILGAIFGYLFAFILVRLEILK